MELECCSGQVVWGLEVRGCSEWPLRAVGSGVLLWVALGRGEKWGAVLGRSIEWKEGK